MVDNIGSIQQGAGYTPKIGLGKHAPLLPRDMRMETKTDAVVLGKSDKISPEKANRMIYERAMQQLRDVVNSAKAELGMADDQAVDTSAEATAGRIADFALGAYSKWADGKGIADDEAGRKQFADFIGKAIYTGIDQAKGILNALNAINPEVSSNIDKITGIINDRLDDFVKNGAQKTPQIS